MENTKLKELQKTRKRLLRKQAKTLNQFEETQEKLNFVEIEINFLEKGGK